jgi:hypothetical protein
MKHSIFLIGIFLLLATGSCKKIKGCKDPEASNFDEKAKIDDGSCTYNYTGEISFWFNESRSITWVSSGVTTLTVYFDDVAHGTIDPEKWTIGPECNGEDTYTTTIEIGAVTSENVSYVIRDQTGASKVNGTINVTKDECKSKQL